MPSTRSSRANTTACNEVLAQLKEDHNRLKQAHILSEQLMGMTAEDEKFAARFTVLCEVVMHHVQEEEGKVFAQLKDDRLDRETLQQDMDTRRAELMGERDEEDEDADPVGAPAAAGR